MYKSEDGTLWLSPSEDQLDVDKEKLMKIINKFENLNFVYKSKHGWASDISDEADGIFYEMLGEWEKKFKSEDVALNSNIKYEHHDPRSIRWEVFSRLHWADPDRLQLKDLPILREFLNTPPGKELEAWEKWEAYWEKRDRQESSRS